VSFDPLELCLEFAFGTFQLRFPYFVGLKPPEMGFMVRKNSFDEK